MAFFYRVRAVVVGLEDERRERLNSLASVV